MIRKTVVRLFSAALIVAGCGGCGGSNTNGSLALTVATSDLTGGVTNVVATAVYTPSTSGSPNNTPITLSAHIHNLSGTTSTVNAQTLNADSTGTVTKSYNITQTSEVLYVDITASTGGLSVTKSVSTSALTSVTTSPTAVSFAVTAVAGDTQTVTVSGGTQPYQAAIDSAHTGAFTVNVNGSTVTLTKLSNSGTTVISAQLTITDNNGNSVTIPVSYY